MCYFEIHNIHTYILLILETEILIFYENMSKLDSLHRQI